MAGWESTKRETPQLHVRNYTCPPMFSTFLHAIAAGVSGSVSVSVSVSATAPVSVSASVVAIASLTICLFSHFTVCVFVFWGESHGFLFGRAHLCVLAARFMFCQTECVSCSLVAALECPDPDPSHPCSHAE